MTLCFSRFTKSDEDYLAFWGTSPTERDISTVQYKFDAMIAQEIQSFQPLPHPFAAAYDLCKDSSVSTKWYLNSVRMRRSDLATDVFSNGLSLPAVLVGDAAHAIPRMMSATDLNRAMWDALDLFGMIVDRYDDDVLFSQITKDFYDVKFRGWQMLQFKWQKKWVKAHGLPWDPYKARHMWVTMGRPSHRLAQQYLPEQLWKSLPEDQQRDLLLYKQRDGARLAVIERRIRDRLERKNTFEVPPGVDPTKGVLRYLDSRPLPKEPEVHNAGQDLAQVRGGPQVQSTMIPHRS